MKKIRIGINGFGRIGRIASRIILNRPQLSLVAINSRADAYSHAYLLKHDTAYGTFPKDINAKDNTLIVDNQKIAVFNYPQPSEIPWKNAAVDIVVDSTGKFRRTDDLKGHLRDTVKYVAISAPAKDSTKTIILGVNEKDFDPNLDKIVSNSSCTTNCLVTTLKVLHDNFKIERGFMNTTHAVTDTQNLLDNSNPEEVRTRRAAFASMIPADTGSGREIKKFFPDLADKILCSAIRVPLLTVSIINLIVQTQKEVCKECINEEFEKASKTYLRGILGYATEELVSHDYIGSPYSSIFDPYLTQVNGNHFVSVSAWYDNEWGYASRLVDLLEFIAKKGNLL
ncbi:type I glyceraldehyde-3-phosphate dehydrogenase [Candidatus Gottesmanbacteria bacterium]|nr:type I glyceraldehyde-3-phosphate dehydrogenase [Candidatus Gottesmanbacteria bacterium]